jgi:hypothetical protein
VFLPCRAWNHLKVFVIVGGIFAFQLRVSPRFVEVVWRMCTDSFLLQVPRIGTQIRSQWNHPLKTHRLPTNSQRVGVERILLGGSLGKMGPLLRLPPWVGSGDFQSNRFDPLTAQDFSKREEPEEKKAPSAHLPLWSLTC